MEFLNREIYNLIENINSMLDYVKDEYIDEQDNIREAVSLSQDFDKYFEYILENSIVELITDRESEILEFILPLKTLIELKNKFLKELE